MHHHTNQIYQPTRCNSFTSLLLDVYVWLNMFREPLRPSSGAYNCTKSLWFYRWSVAVGALLVVAWQTTANNVPTVTWGGGKSNSNTDVEFDTKLSFGLLKNLTIFRRESVVRSGPVLHNQRDLHKLNSWQIAAMPNLFVRGFPVATSC